MYLSVGRPPGGHTSLGAVQQHIVYQTSPLAANEVGQAVTVGYSSYGFLNKVTMSGFDEAWTAIAADRDGEPVSQALRPLLQAVYSQCLLQPLDLLELKKKLEDLLTFLSGQGRTNANCWAVDLFFSIGQGLERDWADQALPNDFHDVLALMGQALHDTIKNPDIAENFDCLPEQLLERVRNLQVAIPD
jgi:hypothetical protein